MAVCGAGALAGDILEVSKSQCVICGDPAPDRLERIGGFAPGLAFEEDHNPLADDSVDLAVSLLTLQAVNDPVGALVQWRKALRPGGLFIGAAFGEETLSAWRAALYEAESALTGGVSPRVHPFSGVRDYGAALQRAGFVAPVVDVDHVDVAYQNPWRLLADLKGMGETSALARRGPYASRRLLAAALKRFAQQGGSVRFDIVFMTAFAPSSR